MLPGDAATSLHEVQEEAHPATEERTPRSGLGTIASYGPDDTRATKVALRIFRTRGGDPEAMKRWYGEEADLRNDKTVAAEIAAFLKLHGIVNVAAPDGIMGCPHEEGIDYPDGEVCPMCPFWARDQLLLDALEQAQKMR